MWYNAPIDNNVGVIRSHRARPVGVHITLMGDHGNMTGSLSADAQ